MVHLIALFNRESVAADTDIKADFGVIITAFNNSQLARQLIESLVHQPYSSYHIYLVIDGEQAAAQFHENPRLSILIPDSPLRSKVKSIVFAIERMKRAHDYSIIFDPDNIASAQLLTVLNTYIQAGYEIVQGQRHPNNLDTWVAKIDGMVDYYYNYALRYNWFKAASSSSIAGSGFSIKTDLLHEIFQKEVFYPKEKDWFIDEDKLLQLSVLSSGKRIAYASDAITLDEKTRDQQGLQKQRSRWFSSHFLSMPEALKLSFKGIRLNNWNMFLFGSSMLIPPIFLLALISGGVLLLDIILGSYWFWVLGIAGCIFSINLGLSLYLNKTPSTIYHAIVFLPVFIANQVLALLKIRRRKANIAPTQHKRED